MNTSQQLGLVCQQQLVSGEHIVTADVSKKNGIAIFASGAGSNAQKIIEYFRNHGTIEIKLVACNKEGAGVLKIAVENKIPSLWIEKEKFFRGNAYLDELKSAGVTFVVLAGFLWKIPHKLINGFRNRIINIHPALLPAYGGKGMYGLKVHESVIAAGEKQSGITIHYVDEDYDAGDIIFQASCNVDVTDSPETLAAKIHVLEHEHYARIIENILSQQSRL